MTACNGLLLTTPPPAQPLPPADHLELCGRATPVLCTEGLGFESSSVDAADMKMETGKEKGECVEVKESHLQRKCIDGDVSRKRRLIGEGKEFPPPISCIGQGGRPGVCFETFKEEGRFVLREIRVAAQEVLQARREGGRLMLSFVQMDDELFEEHDGECKSDDDDEEDGKDEERE